MSETTPRRIRRPGDKVIRRRVQAQQVMELPPAPIRRGAPTLRGNAKWFALVYIGLVLAGAALLTTPLASERSVWTPFVDCLFTAVSATAVTGLVTVDTQDHWSLFGEIIVLGLIQLGGFGFMVGASLVLLTMRRSSSLRGALIMRDGAPTISLREARELSGRILKFILITEAIGAIILAIVFASRGESFLIAVWYGVFHSISAFCNAGFDLQGGFRSMVGYHDSLTMNLTIMSLIQFGALSYIVFADIWEKRVAMTASLTPRSARRYWQRLSLDTKLVVITNYALVVGGAVAFAVVEWNASLDYMTSPFERVVGSLFQSVAARTAGFATIGFSEAHSGTLFLWVALMMVGGASGSTAGGVKLSTFAVVVLTVLSTLRGQTEPQFAGRRIAIDLVFRAITIIALFIMVHFALTLLLVLTEDLIYGQEFGFIDLMFETMSGLATVGVSTGLTPELSTAGKLVLCLAMFVGRLGPLTAVYALQRREERQSYSFPEAYVRMG